MDKIHQNWGQLGGVEDRLIKDLKETTLPLSKLGEKYGVSRQAIFDFRTRKGIKRPNLPKKEHIESCSICQSLIRIAKKPHSEFISSQTIKEKLGLESQKWFFHIGILRKTGLIPQRFGTLQSKKVELAYQIYFKKRLPVSAIGRLVGLKNFLSVIRMHKISGWIVPDPLFTYDGNERRKRFKEQEGRKRR